MLSINFYFVDTFKNCLMLSLTKTKHNLREFQQFSVSKMETTLYESTAYTVPKTPSLGINPKTQRYFFPFIAISDCNFCK